MRQQVAVWSRPWANVVSSTGPVRVVGNEPAPDGWTPPRVRGFTASTDPVAPVGPLVWEGDQA